jgi:uncharacterized protein YjbJ (UPF0337 family)
LAYRNSASDHSSARDFHAPLTPHSQRLGEFNSLRSGNKDSIMSSTTDKASGLANEAIGKAKQGIGSAVGSDKLQVEGAAQELKGDAQKALGDAKDAVKRGTDKAADAINKNM